VAGRVHERGRNVDPGRPAGRFSYWTASAERAFIQQGEYDVVGAAGCNFATRREVAAAVGGIDERLNVGAALYEETEYCLRVKAAGWRVYYNGHAHLNHLVSPSGGCRVDQVEAYVWALAHNRMIVIRRHLRWYQQPVAIAEVLRLGLAYATHYRQPRAMGAALGGMRAGWKGAK
jgi:GT2 family glycosyltransferase